MPEFMRKYLFLLLFTICFSPLQGQNTDTDYLFIPDTINIKENWKDKNGMNTLYIIVNGACNSETGYFGSRSSISVNLQNDKYILNVGYDEENYEMRMILFNKNDIVYKKKYGSQIVFIPFFYCANSDSIVRVSYIIFHNNQKYIKHIDFHCTESGNCKLKTNLKTELQEIPDYLKKEFQKQLSRFITIVDFHQDL